MPNNFENQLRDRLEDHASDVDASAIWDVVEGRLDEKKRRVIIWWQPVLLLLIGFVSWWSTGLDKHNYSSEELTAFPIPLAANSAQGSGTNERSGSQSQDRGYQSSHVFGAAETDLPLMSDAPTLIFSDLAKPVVGDPKSAQLKPSPAPVFESKSEAENQSIAIPAPLANNNLNDDEVKTKVDKAVKPDLLSIRVNNAENTLDLNEDETQKASSTIPVLFPDTLELPDRNLLGRKDNYRLNRRVKSNSEIAFKRDNRPHWSLAFEQAFSLPLPSMVADSPEGNAQAELNKAKVTTLESFSFSLLPGYHFGKHWSLRSGLTYRRINSRTDHQTTSTEDFIDPEGIISIRVDANGDSSFVTGPVASVRTITERFRYYNSKTTFDLPLLLGYEFGKRRFRFSLEGGPVINLGAISQSTLLNTDGAFINVDNDSGWFKNSLSGLGWLASGKVHYPLTPKTRISLSLRYERTPASGFEAAEAGYRTRYELLGVGLGITRRF